MISLHARVRKPFQKVVNFWNGVPEGSHSRPPGRSKSMAFERIFAGRKAPSDVVWPGPPRCSLCLVVTQEVSDVHKSLCKILMVVVEYHHHHHHHHHLVVLILVLVLLFLLLLSCVLVLVLVLVLLVLQCRLVYTILITIINYYILNLD